MSITVIKYDWMLFKVEANGVHYFWDGSFPILVHVPKEAGTLEEHYWLGKDMNDKNLPDVQRTVFETIVSNTKRVFTIGSKPRRYIVIQRGTFKTD